MDDSSIFDVEVAEPLDDLMQKIATTRAAHKRRFGQVELRFQRRPGRYGAGNLGEGEESSLLQRGSSSSLRPYAFAVAPACNIQCNYCNRKYDCANESRPGVVSEKLTPEQAAKKVLASHPPFRR